MLTVVVVARRCSCHSMGSNILIVAYVGIVVATIYIRENPLTVPVVVWPGCCPHSGGNPLTVCGAAGRCDLCVKQSDQMVKDFHKSNIRNTLNVFVDLLRSFHFL